MSDIDVNRSVRLRSTVRVDDACYLNGNVTMPNSVAWPTDTGTTNQVPCLNSSNNLIWCDVSGLSAASEYSRVVVTGSTYSILSTASTVMVNRTASTVLTLPSIASSGTKVYRIIDLGGALAEGSVTITVNTYQTSEKILGQTSYVFSQPYNSITLVNDGSTKWALI